MDKISVSHQPPPKNSSQLKIFLLFGFAFIFAMGIFVFSTFGNYFFVQIFLIFMPVAPELAIDLLVIGSGGLSTAAFLTVIGFYQAWIYKSHLPSLRRFVFLLVYFLSGLIGGIVGYGVWVGLSTGEQAQTENLLVAGIAGSILGWISGSLSILSFFLLQPGVRPKIGWRLSTVFVWPIIWSVGLIIQNLFVSPPVLVAITSALSTSLVLLSMVFLITLQLLFSPQIEI